MDEEGLNMEKILVLDFFGCHLSIGDNVIYIHDGSLTTGKIVDVENKKLDDMDYQLLLKIRNDFRANSDNGEYYPVHVVDARSGIIRHNVPKLSGKKQG